MENDEESVTKSAILNALEKIENKALREYIQKNDLRGEMENVMKAFFDKNREYLPENPFPEITKRFRQTEVRIRWQKSLEIMDDVIDKNMDVFHSSSSTITKLVPIKLFNKIILSCSNKAGAVEIDEEDQENEENEEENEENEEKKEEIETTKGLNIDESDDDIDDKEKEKEEKEKNKEECIKVFGLEHVISGISDIYWIQSICKILKPILKPIETTLDQCYINKISLISSPIFFYDSFDFLHSLSRQHVLYSHLFPRHNNNNNNNNNNRHKSWPHFVANGQIDIYHHVGITSVTFQKAVSVFAKFIQSRIYWISIDSKKSAEYRFFFKNLIVNDNNPHLWTFDEIKRNRKKFETNIKHAVAQKHTIRMIFYFIGPDDTLIFECELYWYFYFRDIKCIKERVNPTKDSGDMKGYNINKLQKELQDITSRKPDWTSFSIKSYYSVYHGFFINYGDIKLFIDLFKHLSFEINDKTFGNSFAEWQLKDWSEILNGLDAMQYGSVLTYLYRLATLVDSTTFDKTKMKFASELETINSIKIIQEFREKVLHEMRLTLYSQGQLFQGFMDCISRIIEILNIFDRDRKEYQQYLQQQQQQKRNRNERNRNIMQDIDDRMAGEWIHKSLISILHRFSEISDFYYPLYSEYLHCIPRIKYLLIESVEMMPSWIDLSKITNNIRILCDEYFNELLQIFDLIGDTLIRDELAMCISTRQWIQQRREYLNSPPPNLQYIPSNNVMIIHDAINYNLNTHKLPNSIPIQGTFLQYAIDTEMDRWFNKTLFRILSDEQVFNPFIKIVIEAQQMSFKYDSYRTSDDKIFEKIINIKEITFINDENNLLYQYQGIYGYKSALLFINSNAMKNIHKDICLRIPNEIMMDNNDDNDDNDDDDNNNDNNCIFLSFCGDIRHYPYFDIALDEVEVIQNVFISGSNFEFVVEIFASHCLNLSQYLFKKSSFITFISLTIGNNTYQCDMIIKKSNYEYILKMLIAATKSRQTINMELMIASTILKKYLSVKLNIFLIYHQIKTNRYRLCWPFRADIIFTSIFFNIDDAIKFWKAYSVGNISNVYNLEHADYRRELLNKLAIYENSAKLDYYFHTALNFKSLNIDYNGIIEIYRFFDEVTLCGKCIESLQQLLLTQKLLNYRKMSRYIKNQMNRQFVLRQIKESVIYSKKIIFSDLLTFFDRTMLTYLRKYYSLYNAIDDEIYPALNQMIKVLIPVKYACTMAWTSWLVIRNKHILIQK